MRKYFIGIFLLCSLFIFGQDSLIIKITDQNENPIPGCFVILDNQNLVTDNYGIAKIIIKERKSYRIDVYHSFYEGFTTYINLSEGLYYEFNLKEKSILLDAILVDSQSKLSVKNTQNISSDYIINNFSGSLSQSLENVSGVNTLSIGSSISKPVIRGLSFNRVVVTENNLKHEAQAWGADHGLEIDAFNGERVTLLKGASTLEFGSDAIGGVLEVSNHYSPEKEGFSGKIVSTARSINNGILSHIDLSYKKTKYFYKIKANIYDFADYKIPTDTILYLSRKIPVYNKKLKNTAGIQQNLFGQFGYENDQFKSVTTLSNHYSKTGYFPGSHGIPDLDRLQNDGNDRNIDYPYQKVNHFKFQQHINWNFTKYKIISDIQFQRNVRQEISAFHTHYPNLANVITSNDLELYYDLYSIDLNLKSIYQFNDATELKMGLQSQYQKNKIGGYSFLLPEFSKRSLGIYSLLDYQIRDNLLLNFGIRTDFNGISISEYFDNNLYNYLSDKGYSESLAQSYATRSNDFDRNFSNLNLLMGFNYKFLSNWNISANIGTHFRTPTAIELSSNGVHHGAFREERGNRYLNEEKGLVSDLQLKYSYKSGNLNLSPYLYFFDNYIFLKPSGEFSVLPHGGQIYKYDQSKALLRGFEIEWNHNIIETLDVNLIAEYLDNYQLNQDNTKGLPLPFSPAPNLFGKVTYSVNNWKFLSNNKMWISTKYFTSQNKFSQNESRTPESKILNLGINSDLILRDYSLNITLSCTNILDKKYYNHMSYYRALNIPEAGRNIQLSVTFNF